MSSLSLTRLELLFLFGRLHQSESSPVSTNEELKSSVTPTFRLLSCPSQQMNAQQSQFHPSVKQQKESDKVTPGQVNKTHQRHSGHLDVDGHAHYYWVGSGLPSLSLPLANDEAKIWTAFFTTTECNQVRGRSGQTSEVELALASDGPIALHHCLLALPPSIYGVRAWPRSATAEGGS